VRTPEQEQLLVDFRKFIKNLMFEDAGTVLDKAYRWLKVKPVEGFSINVDMRGKHTVNALISFSHNDNIAITLFESK